MTGWRTIKVPAVLIAVAFGMLLLGGPAWAAGLAGTPQAVQSQPPPEPGSRSSVNRPRVPGAGRAGRPSPEGRTVAEVEQLFDRYVLGQARQALRLTRDQMTTFAPRLQHLQQTRRRAARQRQMLLRELNEMTRVEGAADDAALSAKLAALEQQVAASEQQVREAYQQLEQVLSVEQRARLRLFEQRMERQKLQLIARARGQGPSQPEGETPPQ